MAHPYNDGNRTVSIYLGPADRLETAIPRVSETPRSPSIPRKSKVSEAVFQAPEAFLAAARGR